MSEFLQLVCRPRPFPHESLGSYLLRLRAENGYERLIWLTSWLRDKTTTRSRFRSNTTNAVGFLERLATVTAVPVFDLYHRTMNRYVSFRTFPGRPVQYQRLSSGEQVAFRPDSHSMNHWLRTDAATAFCPRCLREASYHRLSWLLDAVFACTKHGCWLLDRCATCGETVSVEAVLQARCARCSTTLTDLPVTPLDATAFTAQQYLLLCLETGKLPTNTLPPLSVQALFRLLDGLCAVTRTLGWEWDAFYQPEGIVRPAFPSGSHAVLAPVQHGSLYTNAWLVVNDWPRGFETFLDRYLRHVGGDGVNMQRHLGSLYEVWLEREWRHPDLEPVQTAFNAYFVRRVLPSTLLLSIARVRRYPSLREQIQWIDRDNAARFLGVSSPTIARMVRDGYVRAQYPQAKPDAGGYFVCRADLENGLQRRSSVVTLGQVAADFFTTGAVIQEWIEAGLMPQTGLRLERGVPHPSLTRKDVDCFLDRLANQVCLQAQRPTQALTLKMVCMTNNKIGLTSAHVFQRVLDGKLDAYHTDPRLQPFSDLWFDSAEAAVLTERVKAENNWLSLRELAPFLHVKLKTVRHWMQAGLLVPTARFNRSIYFDRTAVIAFQQRLLRSHEVAKWLETTDAALSHWVCGGYLSVLPGTEGGQRKTYYFDRDVIARWHTTYVTAGEARRILGKPSYMIFRQLVRRGEYASPISANLSTRFYYRADIEQFQTDWEQ
jgi:hypothetical protein